MWKSGFVAVAVFTILLGACGDGSISSGLQSKDERTPIEPTTEPTSTPKPSFDFQVEVADFNEQPSTTARPREGWRLVELSLYVEYLGGTEQELEESLVCGTEFGRWTNAIRVKLKATNGGEYELKATPQRCFPPIPGLRARMKFQGEVPEVLGSIEGSMVTVSLADPSEGTPEPVSWEESGIPVTRAAKFTHGSLAKSARALPATIELGGGRFVVDQVAYVGNSGAEVLLKCANETGYDWSASLWGILVDAKGEIYGLGGHCELPPGHANSSWANVGDSSERSPSSQPDLSDFVMVYVERGKSYVLRGSAPAPTGCPLFRVLWPTDPADLEADQSPEMGESGVWSTIEMPDEATMFIRLRVDANAVAAAIERRRSELGGTSVIKTVRVDTEESGLIRLDLDETKLTAYTDVFYELDRLLVPCPLPTPIP